MTKGKRLFGKYITTQHVMQREHAGVYRKVWREQSIRKTVCLVIGERTIFNGTIDYSEDEGNTWFIQTKSIRVLIVVINERTNPVYIPYNEVQ